MFTTASNLGDYNFYTKDSISIHSACMNSEWNYNLVSNILRHSFVNKIDIQNYKTKNNFLSSLDVIEKEKKKNTFKKFFLYTYSKIQNLSYPLYKKNNYYIKDSCLPKLTELKLSLLLKQFPILFKDQIEIPEKYDDRIRNKINLEKKNIDEVEKVIRFFIPNLLPTTYLENYLFIKEKSKNLKWPNNPKAIITGNSYEFDELFKFWSADKLTKGTKYYIFQHGTLHASHVSIEQSNEYQVCDRYFNWGKKFNNKKNVKTFNFKLFNIKKTKLKKIKILVICKARGYEIEAYDRGYEYKKIFAGVKTLIKLLPKKILENAHFRIKDIFKKNDERDFLNSNNLKILDSNSNIFQYMKSSDLVVHMYNSTGVLECLSLNIPTMFYWPDSKNYRNYYDDDFISFCKDKQILCETAESLVENIIEKFHDIDEWWNQNELQSERRFICEQYSALPNKNSLKDLTKKIKHEK